MTKGIVGVGLVAMGIAACSVSTESPERVGTTKHAIINGKASDASQDWVVRLMIPVNAFAAGGCTGSLLAPNLVLTARHCVSETSDRGFGCDMDGNVFGGGGKVVKDHDPANIFVFTGSKRDLFEQPKDAPAHGVKIFHDGASVLCSHDLALLVLDKPLEGVPIAKIRLEDKAVPGELMTAVGWGVTSITREPVQRQQRTGIKILQVGPYKGDDRLPALPPNDFVVGESICSGDSGGPGYAESTGAIIGVTSRGGNGAQNPTSPEQSCQGPTTRNEMTMVAPFKDMILEAFKEAGYDPWVEGGPDPRLAKLGEACDAPEACRGGLCIDGRCSQPCDVDACPASFECKPSGDVQACFAKPNEAKPSGISCAMGHGSAGGFGAVVAIVLGALLRRRRATK